MIDLDLTFYLKEVQLQNGLRGEDYNRYHKYISNRVATLRKQLHLSNEKKKFLYKEITSSNATSSKHLVLVAFYAERCWASAETMQARLKESEGRVGSAGGGTTGGRATGVVGNINVPGGLPPRGQYLKRLSKAVKWAENLVSVAKAVGSSRVQMQSEAYLAEAKGRNFLAHNNVKGAKEEFCSARDLHYKLLLQLVSQPSLASENGEASTSSLSTKVDGTGLNECEEEESRNVLQEKIYEMDDRVLYCMQRRNEDVSSYSPPSVEVALKHRGPSSQQQQSAIGARQEDGSDATLGVSFSSSSWWWNGRALTVYSTKIRAAVREARAVPVEALERKFLNHHSSEDRSEKTLHDSNHLQKSSSPVSLTVSSFSSAVASKGKSVVPVGQVNRVLDALDRRIGYYNDALAHARQDLRAAVEETSNKTTLQLLVHYLLYHVAEGKLHRKLFLAEIHARRFQATEKAILYKRQVEDAAAPREVKMKRKKEKKEILPPSQYASPLEVIRLYETATETVEEMTLLPGVSERDDLEAYEALCAAGKALYIGEACRIQGDFQKAEVGYRTAMEILEKKAIFRLTSNDSKSALNSANSSFKKETETYLSLLLNRAKVMYAEAEQLALQAASLQILQSASLPESRGSSVSSIAYLSDAVSNRFPKTKSIASIKGSNSDADDVVVAVAKHVMPFPPSYQIAPAKPTFVDIASTYIDFGQNETEEQSTTEHVKPGTKLNTVDNSKNSGGKKSHVDPSLSSFAGNADSNSLNSSSNTKDDLRDNENTSSKKEKKGWGFKWGWGSK